MQKSSIAQAIEGNTKLVFKPNVEFYDNTQINKKRWALIYRGEKEATKSELEKIAEYFSIPIQKFFK